MKTRNIQTRLRISKSKKKSVKKMDEARAINKIEANLPQEKIYFINSTHLKDVQYWKKIALENRNEDERRQLTDLAPF